MSAEVRSTRETTRLLKCEVTGAKVYNPDSQAIQLLACFNQDIFALYIPVKDSDRVHVDDCVHQLSHDVLKGTKAEVL